MTTPVTPVVLFFSFDGPWGSLYSKQKKELWRFLWQGFIKLVRFSGHRECHLTWVWFVWFAGRPTVQRLQSPRPLYCNGSMFISRLEYTMTIQQINSWLVRANFSGLFRIYINTFLGLTGRDKNHFWNGFDGYKLHQAHIENLQALRSRQCERPQRSRGEETTTKIYKNMGRKQTIGPVLSCFFFGRHLKQQDLLYVSTSMNHMFFKYHRILRH